MRTWSVLAIVGTMLALGVSPSVHAADEIVYHSGTIESVDVGTGRLSLAEVGPWRVVNGVTVTTHVPVTLTDVTDVVLALRAEEGRDDDFPGTFVYAPLALSDLAAGDHVTVECDHRGGAFIARRIFVVLAE